MARTYIQQFFRPLTANGSGLRAGAVKMVKRMTPTDMINYGKWSAARKLKQPTADLMIPKEMEARFTKLENRANAAQQADNNRLRNRAVYGTVLAANGIGLGIGLTRGKPGVQGETDMQNAPLGQAIGAGQSKLAALTGTVAGPVKELLLGGMEVAEPLIAASVGSIAGAGLGYTASKLNSPVGISTETAKQEELARNLEKAIKRVNERVALNAYRANIGRR